MNYQMRLPSLKIFLATFLFCGYFLVSAQYQIPEKPSVLWPVHDTVGLLSESEKQELNQKLIKFEDSTSTEIGAVSYTHLDVYKRQSLYFHRFFFP